MKKTIQRPYVWVLAPVIGLCVLGFVLSRINWRQPRDSQENGVSVKEIQPALDRADPRTWPAAKTAEIDQRIQELESGHHDHRIAAIEWLSTHRVGRRRQAVSRAIETLLDDAVVSVQNTAARALGSTGDMESAGKLRVHLIDCDSPGPVIKALGQLRSEASVPAIISFYDGYPIEAKFAIERIASNPESLLIQQLHNSDPNVCRHACTMLEDIGTEQCIDKVRELLKHHDPQVQSSAQSLLIALNKRLENDSTIVVSKPKPRQPRPNDPKSVPHELSPPELTPDSASVRVTIPTGQKRDWKLSRFTNVLVPSGQSSMFLIRSASRDHDHQVWDLNTGTNTASLAYDVIYPIAMSSDGTRFVGRPPEQGGRRSQLLVCDDAGTVISDLEVEEFIPDIVEFQTRDRLITGQTSGRLQVWDLAENRVLSDIRIPVLKRPRFAFSANCRYVAIHMREESQLPTRLEFFDVGTGKKAGEVAVSREFREPNGLAFSPDGSLIAAFFRGKQDRIHVWSTATGVVVHEHIINGLPRDPHQYDTTFQWRQDQSGWLVFGRSLVEYESGEIIWDLPVDRSSQGVRRWLDSNHVLIEHSRSQLTLVELPTDLLESRTTATRDGRSGVDVGIPVANTADWTDTKRIEVSIEKPWEVTPGKTSRVRPPLPRFTLKNHPNEVIGAFVSGPEELSLTVHTGATAAIPQVGTSTAEIYNLRTGRRRFQVSLPPQCKPVALNSEGTRLITSDSLIESRLDLWEVSSGTHLAGWYPGDSNNEMTKVTWVTFGPNDSVLTLDGQNQFVCWDLPACKARYSIDNVYRVATSRDDKYVANLHHAGLNIHDTHTGHLMGRIPLSPVTGDPGAVTFHPQGSGIAIVRADRPGHASVTTWNMSGQQINSIESVFATDLRWLNDRFLLVGHAALIDLELERQLWHYGAGTELRHLNQQFESKHWGLWSPIRRTEEGRMATTVEFVSSSIPDQQVESRLQLLDQKRMIVGPGSTINIHLALAGLPADREAITKQVADTTVARLSEAGLSPRVASTMNPPILPVPHGKESQYTGTGFVVSPDGVVVTCAHVVEGATNVHFILGTETQSAIVVAMDRLNDLALLRIEGRFKPLRFAVPDNLNQAPQVWALGYPLMSDLGATLKMTRGTIVAQTQLGLIEAFETDANINPGNSGGPLVDTKGSVLGVNFLKSNEQDFKGWAVSSKHVQDLLNSHRIRVIKTSSSAREMDGPKIFEKLSPAVGLVVVTQRPESPAIVPLTDGESPSCVVQVSPTATGDIQYRRRGFGYERVLHPKLALHVQLAFVDTNNETVYKQQRSFRCDFGTTTDPTTLQADELEAVFVRHWNEILAWLREGIHPILVARLRDKIVRLPGSSTFPLYNEE